MGIVFALLKNKYVAGGALLTIVGLGLFGYYKYQTFKINSLQEKLEKVTEVLIIRDQEVRQLKTDFNTLETTVQNNEKLRSEVEEFKATVREDIDQRMKVFEGERLEGIAAKKPKLIERKVNSATIKVFEEIEEETKAFVGRNQ